MPLNESETNMLDDRSQEEVAAVSRVTRIIVGSLCGGVLLFAGYMLFTRDAEATPTLGMLTIASLGAGVIATMLALIVPRHQVNQARQQFAAGKLQAPASGNGMMETDAGKLAGVYQQTTIVGCGLLEGAAFLALVAYLIENHWLALGVAGAMLLGVALHFPFGGRIADWTETQLQFIKDGKAMKPLD